MSKEFKSEMRFLSKDVHGMTRPILENFKKRLFQDARPLTQIEIDQAATVILERLKSLQVHVVEKEIVWIVDELQYEKLIKENSLFDQHDRVDFSIEIREQLKRIQSAVLESLIKRVTADETLNSLLVSKLLLIRSDLAEKDFSAPSETTNNYHQHNIVRRPTLLGFDAVQRLQRNPDITPDDRERITALKERYSDYLEGSRLFSRLSGHPNILKHLAVDSTEGALLLEYRNDIRDVFEDIEKGIIPSREVLSVLHDFIKVAQFLEEHGLVWIDSIMNFHYVKKQNTISGQLVDQDFFLPISAHTSFRPPKFLKANCSVPRDAYRNIYCTALTENDDLHYSASPYETVFNYALSYVLIGRLLKEKQSDDDIAQYLEDCGWKTLQPFGVVLSQENNVEIFEETDPFPRDMWPTLHQLDKELSSVIEKITHE